MFAGLTYRQRLAITTQHLLIAHNRGKGELARALGYTAAWTSKILRDERPISTDDLPRVAEFFGLTVDDFLALSRWTDRRVADRRQGDRRRPSPDPECQPGSASRGCSDRVDH